MLRPYLLTPKKSLISFVLARALIVIRAQGRCLIDLKEWGALIKFIHIALMLSVIVCPSANATSDCQITNLMPSYWTFWASAKNQDTERQAELFRNYLSEPHEDIYSVIFAQDSKIMAQSMEWWMPKMQNKEHEMRQLTAGLSRQLPTQLNSFRTAFPDFNCSVPVFFLVSVGPFDGATRTINDKTALLFGIDMIASYHGNNFGPLVSHELFHVYHEQTVGENPEEVYWALWPEGLASYVSAQLHPEIPVKKYVVYRKPNPSNPLWLISYLDY